MYQTTLKFDRLGRLCLVSSQGRFLADPFKSAFHKGQTVSAEFKTYGFGYRKVIVRANGITELWWADNRQ